MGNLSRGEQSAFARWLRTGRLPRFNRSSIELKFNPWHDAQNGRFTFAGTGNYFPPSAGRAATNVNRPSPPFEYADDTTKPAIASVEEADAWRAEQLAKHGQESGYPEAIEARHRLYIDALTPGPLSFLEPASEFAVGAGEAIYDIGKETAAGLYSLVTTNPITSLRDIERGIAGTIDAIIAAEDTPAHVQLERAAETIAGASPRELGYGLGTVAGNAALIVAPEAIIAKISAARASSVRMIEPTGIKDKVVWVDESVSTNRNAMDYNASAMGARSNIATKKGQAPALRRKMPNGTTRLVKFDGLEGNALIDRKWSIYTSEKLRAQAIRQSDALFQHDANAIWEVPTPQKRAIAVRFLNRLNITNIKVRVARPWTQHR